MLTHSLIIGINLIETMEASLISNLKRLSNTVNMKSKSMQKIQDICLKIIGTSDNYLNISKTVKDSKF